MICAAVAGSTCCSAERSSPISAAIVHLLANRSAVVRGCKLCKTVARPVSAGTRSWRSKPRRMRAARSCASCAHCLTAMQPSLQCAALVSQRSTRAQCICLVSCTKHTAPRGLVLCHHCLIAAVEQPLPCMTPVTASVGFAEDPIGLLPPRLILGINKRGVHFFRPVPKEYLHSAELRDIMQV